jgi:hypothetical protein
MSYVLIVRFEGNDYGSPPQDQLQRSSNWTARHRSTKRS